MKPRVSALGYAGGYCTVQPLMLSRMLQGEEEEEEEASEYVDTHARVIDLLPHGERWDRLLRDAAVQLAQAEAADGSSGGLTLIGWQPLSDGCSSY